MRTGRERWKTGSLGAAAGAARAEAGRVRAVPDRNLVGLLVGSKPAKLMQGVPLCLAIAEL